MWCWAAQRRHWIFHFVFSAFVGHLLCSNEVNSSEIEADFKRGMSLSPFMTRLSCSSSIPSVLGYYPCSSYLNMITAPDLFWPCLHSHQNPRLPRPSNTRILQLRAFVLLLLLLPGRFSAQISVSSSPLIQISAHILRTSEYHSNLPFLTLKPCCIFLLSTDHCWTC